MVKQQMYLPLHGGPPVPVRGTPPRKAKKTPPHPQRASVVVPSQPSPGATMTRRNTIVTTGRPLVAPLQLPNGPARRNTIATTSTRRTTTTTTTPVSAPTAVKPRASTPPITAAAAAKTAAPAQIPVAAAAPLTPALAPTTIAKPTPLAPAPPIAAAIVAAQDPPPPALTPDSTTAPINRRGKQRKPLISLPPLRMEPYDGLNSAALRQECKRRGISIWTKENSELRHKNGYIKLLQEDDQRRAAQDASAAIHKQDLAQLQLGTFAATNQPAIASSPSTLTPTTGYSFLSPSALMSTPASAAAATAAVLYPPASLLNAAPAQPIVPSPVSTPAVFVPLPPAPITSSKPAVASTAKPKAKTKSKAQTSTVVAPPPPTRSIRPRRGCYFRLINVLLTPEFNVRWREMNDKIADSDTHADVNQFWLDVHVAYMSVNQLFDGLHFHDALFKNVDPSVILAHEASRLRQMWLEVVAKYQKAVADSKKPPPSLQADGNDQGAVNSSDETQSFFDSCGKRLDLLYLHMGLLLEPELSKFVLSIAPSVGSTGSQRSLPAKPVNKTSVTTTSGNQKSATAATGKKRASVSPNTSKKQVKPRASMTPPRERATSFTMSSPPPQLTVPFSPVRPAVFGAASREPEEEYPGQSYALVVSGELRDSAFETFAPHSFGDDGSGSSDYDSELPTRAMAPRKRRRRSSEISTDIVELHSSALRGNELVPHQGNNNNRMHSTALTTRTGSGSDLLLPPDEWVILENRLRKVSESLDRCHRALSGSEGQVSESHRMSLESDLRFYSAIKQRLQEQLLMVMQGF